MQLKNYDQLFFRQRRELAELFGFETRNKYEILDGEKKVVGFAAEKRLGILDFIFRQYLGHWRPFEIQIFSPDRQLEIRAKHPFRLFFQRLEIFGAAGERLGAIEQRFALFSKRFVVQSAAGHALLEVSSPIWRLWTFPFLKDGRERAVVAKRWNGLLSEMFTDRDNFAIHFVDRSLTEEERRLILGAALFIDLQYFEKKA
ncbi:MAG: hypothetical protein EOP11_02925 [Proteobacteria bacterium]|nr:MAG: hypothetical protein EOP11_02925 [Pseudomonadota bacterium]